CSESAFWIQTSLTALLHNHCTFSAFCTLQTFLRLNILAENPFQTSCKVKHRSTALIQLLHYKRNVFTVFQQPTDHPCDCCLLKIHVSCNILLIFIPSYFYEFIFSLTYFSNNAVSLSLTFCYEYLKGLIIH